MTMLAERLLDSPVYTPYPDYPDNLCEAPA